METGVAYCCDKTRDLCAAVCTYAWIFFVLRQCHFLRSNAHTLTITQTLVVITGNCIRAVRPTCVASIAQGRHRPPRTPFITAQRTIIECRGHTCMYTRAMKYMSRGRRTSQGRGDQSKRVWTLTKKIHKRVYIYVRTYVRF